MDFREILRSANMFGSCTLSTMPKYMGLPLNADVIKTVKQRLSIPSDRCSIVKHMIEMERPEKSFDGLRKEMDAAIGRGIFKKKISEGFGEPLKESQEVTVQFSMIFENGLHNSSLYGDPFTFIVGRTGGLLPGFEQAVMTMQNQEKAHFIVNHELLYGSKGMMPDIPPNQDGFLIMEVLKVFNHISMTEEVALSCSFSETMARVEEFRAEAKAAFDSEFYRVAIDTYLRIIELLAGLLVQSPIENLERHTCLARIYLNAGITYNKLDLPLLALNMLRMAIVQVENQFLDDLSTAFKGKLHLHTGRTLCLLKKFSPAFETLMRARDFLGEKETREEFRTFHQAYKKQMSICNDVEGQAFHPENVASAKGFNEGSSRIVLEHIIKSFIESNEESSIFYAIYRKDFADEVQKLARKHKIKVETIWIKDECTYQYVFTRK